MPISIFNWKYRKAKAGDEIIITYDKNNPNRAFIKEDINQHINTYYILAGLFVILLTLKIIRLSGIIET